MTKSQYALVSKLRRKCKRLLRSRHYTFGPGGQPAVVGNELWHVSTMDFKTYTISGSPDTSPHSVYFVSDEGVVKEVPLADNHQNAPGVTSPRTQPVVGYHELAWLVHLVKGMNKAMPYISFMEPLASWMTRANMR